MNSLTLRLFTPLFQKQPPLPTLFGGGGGGAKKEREGERFQAYSFTLSRQGPPARQLFLS